MFSSVSGHPSSLQTTIKSQATKSGRKFGQVIDCNQPGQQPPMKNVVLAKKKLLTKTKDENSPVNQQNCIKSSKARSQLKEKKRQDGNNNCHGTSDQVTWITQKQLNTDQRIAYTKVVIQNRFKAIQETVKENGHLVHQIDALRKENEFLDEVWQELAEVMKSVGDQLDL